jgi:c-di-GMP phosphodiesterase
MNNLFIARQAIYDKTNSVAGYELLYRSSEVNKAMFDDGNQASCETIINSFMHVGIDNLVGSSLAFINLPHDFIVNETLTPMFEEQSVLEILEDINPTKEVIEGVKRLKKQGYRIALDDFIFKDELVPLINLADFIKIEVNNKNKEEIKAQLDLLKEFNLKIIAEKVETIEIYEICKNLGFELMQGYYFSHPQIVKQKNIATNKSVAMNLMQELQDPEIDYIKLETILSQDVALSYKLLRYINSAEFSLRREVDSLKDAVVLLGIKNVKNWVSLLLMSKALGNKPNELIIIAMVRAKMCELLADKFNPEIKHQMFIIGLFSVLDSLMDTPMIELLDTIILSGPIKLALLDQYGEHGEIYKLVLLYEEHKWDELMELAHISADASQFSDAYVEAVLWADSSMKALL